MPERDTRLRAVTDMLLTGSQWLRGWGSFLVAQWSTRECTASVLKYTVQAILDHTETLGTPTEMLSQLKGYQPLVCGSLVSTAVTAPKHPLYHI